MNTALILIDIQNDYFPGGIMELVGMENATQKARELLNNFRNKHFLEQNKIYPRIVANFFI